MSDDETKTPVGEQDGELTSSGDSASGESTADGIRKRMSRTRSAGGKSRTNVRRKKSDPNVWYDGVGSETPRAAEWIERIAAVPVVAVGRLKDGYYRDLRSLLPPADLPESRRAAEGTVNGVLRGVHGAIDEIERWLNRVDLSAFDRDAGTPSETVCARTPFKCRVPKPVAGVAMKTYRVANGHVSPKPT